MDLLKIDRAFTSRYLNEGFSGGEKKRAEILQLAMLQPDFAVLDETDSGLDIDALRIVSDGVNAMRGGERGFLIITHYTRILNYVKPDFVHIMIDGRIVQEGGSELAAELEDKGYEWVREEVAASAVPELRGGAAQGRARGLRGRRGAHLAALRLLDHHAARARPGLARAPSLRAGASPELDLGDDEHAAPDRPARREHRAHGRSRTSASS